MSDAISQYRCLAEEVFSEKKPPWKDGTFKASKLEGAIKQVIDAKLGVGHQEEKMFELDHGHRTCKT